MSLLPHTTQPITSEPASYEMRAWMENVTTSFSNINFEYVFAVGDVTTLGSQFIRVGGPYTVTLNPDPVDGETVQIQPDGAYTVTIVGLINGVTPSYISAAYDFLEVRYVKDIGEWVG